MIRGTNTIVVDDNGSGISGKQLKLLTTEIQKKSSLLLIGNIAEVEILSKGGDSQWSNALILRVCKLYPISSCI